MYPGSVKGHCERCQLEVWIGPKAQEWAEREPVEIVCFVCAITAAAASPVGMDVVELGNTFLRRPS